MTKITLKENDLKLFVEKIISEQFNLTTPEMKLEFLITKLNDLIRELDYENSGDVIYYGNKLKSILKTIGINISEAIVSESVVRKVVKNVLNEWRPRTGYDEWANLETGGAHGRGIQNRRNFTRKENSKGEESTPLQTKTDFIQLILKVDPYNDEINGKIFNVIIKRYKNKILTLGDIHLITEISQIKNTPIGQRLIQFVDSENEVTHFYPPNFREKEVSNKQQPK